MPARRPQPQEVDAVVDRLTLGTARGRTPEPRPLRNLLVATDGGRASGWGLRWAAAIAKAFGAEVHVVAVAPAMPSGSRWALVAEEAAGLEGKAETILQDAARRLARSGVQVALHLERGSPVSRIVAVAHAVEADLVVLGARNKRSPWGLGSVATAVRHHAKRSVLVARAAPPPRRILAATDGSPLSRLAVATSLEWSKTFASRLTLLHALELPPDTPRARAFLAPRSREALQALQAGRMPAGTRDLEYRASEGPAAPAILEEARRAKAGLVVVGSRGRGGLRSLVLGSVSDTVSRDAHCSVLVVKP